MLCTYAERNLPEDLKKKINEEIMEVEEAEESQALKTKYIKVVENL